MNKFNEIFLDLEEKILSGHYPAETLLPSEYQLIEIYQVSRETIRKALSLLQDAGYIQKKQGKGSIVIPRNRFSFPISGLTSFKELEESHHLHAKTQVASLKKIAVSPELSKMTSWPVASEAWELIRKRVIDEEVVILDIDYLDASIIPTLPFEKAKNSIYQYFEKDLGLEIAYAQKEIRVDPVDKKTRDLMSLPISDSHVVAVRSLVYLKDARCFEYTKSLHRLDKFRFVEFARRRKNT